MIKKYVKMKVVSEEQYLKLQDLLFDNGIYWGSDGFHREKSDFYGAKHIYVCMIVDLLKILTQTLRILKDIDMKK